MREEITEAFCTLKESILEAPAVPCQSQLAFSAIAVVVDNCSAAAILTRVPECLTVADI